MGRLGTTPRGHGAVSLMRCVRSERTDHRASAGRLRLLARERRLARSARRLTGPFLKMLIAPLACLRPGAPLAGAGATVAISRPAGAQSQSGFFQLREYRQLNVASMTTISEGTCGVTSCQIKLPASSRPGERGGLARAVKDPAGLNQISSPETQRATPQFSLSARQCRQLTGNEVEKHEDVMRSDTGDSLSIGGKIGIVEGLGIEQDLAYSTGNTSSSVSGGANFTMT
ncbi:hypothetical protein AAFF_G00249000 [Aldrovandia affinis]|uniref:Uncharacterized protein n=1 Tax=Aldrovandia affinis TaxID=143900 RepID=A0AAD7RFW6_9TELE|nr:hypothetical protein AAFF_G00249000 [Aldrovandia affinis]